MGAHSIGSSRRAVLRWLASFAALPLMGARPLRALTHHSPDRVIVYKRVGCMCCAKWVTYLETEGFEMHATEEPDLDLIKDRLGVPVDLRGCHTAVLQGYVIEGHVPADVIAQCLEEKPEIAGLAVPGMPVGSPGMEIDGATSAPYDIRSFQRDGTSTVFATRG